MLKPSVVVYMLILLYCFLCLVILVVVIWCQAGVEDAQRSLNSSSFYLYKLECRKVFPHSLFFCSNQVSIVFLF